MKSAQIAWLAITIWPAIGQGQQIQHGLRVPAGFEVVEFADSALANDIYCLTMDPKGRVVVAGRGYIRILVDDNADGKADRAIDFANEPADGAMGMCWEIREESACYCRSISLR